jgi:hypothetical protein
MVQLRCRSQKPEAWSAAIPGEKLFGRSSQFQCVNHSVWKMHDARHALPAAQQTKRWDFRNSWFNWKVARTINHLQVCCLPQIRGCLSKQVPPPPLIVLHLPAHEHHSWECQKLNRFNDNTPWTKYSYFCDYSCLGCISDECLTAQESTLHKIQEKLWKLLSRLTHECRSPAIFLKTGPTKEGGQLKTVTDT